MATRNGRFRFFLAKVIEERYVHGQLGEVLKKHSMMLGAVII